MVHAGEGEVVVDLVGVSHCNAASASLWKGSPNGKLWLSGGRIDSIAREMLEKSFWKFWRKVRGLKGFAKKVHLPDL